MTTVKDVAARAGVSVATVSRVLAGTYPVAEATRQRVLEAVEALHYQPNGVARSLRRARTETIGIVVPDIANPYFMRLVRALEQALADRRYDLLLASSGEIPEREAGLLKMFFRKRVDAVVVAPAGDRLEEAIKAFHHARVPLVVVDRRLPRRHFDVVAEEAVGASRDLVHHLITMGHRRIALINGPLEISTAADREAGYRRALEEAGLAVEPRWIWRGGFDEETGYRAGKRLLDMGAEGPTAAFCTNNLITIGLLRAVYESGGTVPRDLSVVSFGDPFPAEFVHPRITAVLQNPEAVGRTAAQLLLQRLEPEGEEVAGVTEVILPTMVRLGESVGAPAHP